MPLPELIVDKFYDENRENIYYISPENLNQLKFVKVNSFSKATIKNCKVTNLTSFNLQCLYNTLEKGSSATITIDQPILVLQEYDSNSIISNAELAGFKNIKTGKVNTFCEDLGSKIETIYLVLTK